MEKKKISHILAGAGAAAEAVLTLMVLWISSAAGKLTPEVFISRPGTVAAVLMLYALISWAILLYITICRRIGDGSSFCKENTDGLFRIFQLLLIAAVLLLVFSLLLIRPLRIRIYLSAAAVLLALLSVLSWGLSRLVSQATVLKEENDLTI